MNDTARQLIRMLPQVISLIAEASKAAGASGAVPRYLEILAALVGQGERAYDELMALRNLVRVMVQQKREPTADEWTTMVIRSDAAHNRIQSYDFDAEEPLPAISQLLP